MSSVAVKGHPSRVEDALETKPQMGLVRSEPEPEQTAVQPTDFAGLMRLCEALVPTGFLPEHIKTAGQAAAIILAGKELGMDPMLALRSITMVKGKIVVAADAQLALFKKAGGRATFAKLSDSEAVLDLVHPNGDRHTETFTQADAHRAGLDRPSRNGEPSMYTKFPKAMLRSRAITAGLKSIGFEPTSGTYDPDEAQHFMVPPEPAGTTELARAEVVHAEVVEEEQPLTLERALDMTLPGKPDKWNNNGGKQLRDVPTGVLVRVKEWMTKTDAGKFEPQIQAIAMVVADRDAKQGELEVGAAHTDGETPVASEAEAGGEFDPASLEDKDDGLPF